jgi:hypothetical protein
MAKNNGITNAQNKVFDQSDDAIGGRTQNDAFSFGSAALSPAFNPDTGNMWFGTGNPNTGWNLTDKGNLEVGLKVIHRQGADYTPTGSGRNGEQDYQVTAGPQTGNLNRAEWNFNYVINTASGVAAGDTFDLTKAPRLADFDFKMQITQSGPTFLHPHTAIFDLNAATHVWVDESNPTVAFGGDDFPSGSGASTEVMSHIAQNSVNLKFLEGEFGALATSTAAGTEYDIVITGFKAGTGNLETYTHDHVTLVAPPA